MDRHRLALLALVVFSTLSAVAAEKHSPEFLEEAQRLVDAWHAATERLLRAENGESASSSLLGDSDDNGLKIWGAYCGPGHLDRTFQTPPKDALDACCKTHDRCYKGTSDFFSTNSRVCGCETNLQTCYRSAQCFGNACKVARFAIGKVFGPKAQLCRAREKLQPALANIRNGAQNLWNKASNGAQNLWNKARNAGQNLWNKARDGAQNLWRGFRNGAQNLLEKGRNFLSGARSRVQGLVDKSRSFGQRISEGAKNLWGGARQRLDSLLSRARQGIRDNVFRPLSQVRNRMRNYFGTRRQSQGPPMGQNLRTQGRGSFSKTLSRGRDWLRMRRPSNRAPGYPRNARFAFSQAARRLGPVRNRLDDADDSGSELETEDDDWQI